MSKALSFLTAAVLATGLSVSGANAATETIFDVASFQQNAMIEAQYAGLNWKVGDKANYSVKGGILNGKIAGFVREDTGTQLWVQQDAELGVFGKQKVEILFDKADGSIKKLLVNGKEETPPDPSRSEVIEVKEDKITTPAGTFECVYAKIKDKQSGEISEAWVNPSKVPMVGMLKTIAPSQIGQVTVLLQSFSFAK